MTIIANTYVSEVFPARVRGKYMGRVVTIGLIGIPVTAFVARFLIPIAPWGWRLVFVWGGLGIFALILAARMVESPRWFLRKEQPARAEAVLAQLEAAAMAEHGTVSVAEADVVVTPPPPASVSPIVALFERRQLGRTIILLLAWVFQTLGFYGFVAWVPTLLVQHGFSLVQSLQYTSLIAICNPIGSLVASVLIERFERKWFITVIGLIVAVSGLGYGLSGTPVFIVLFGALVVASIQAMAVSLYTYTPELYPTSMRSSGMGITYGLGRLANVAGPFIVSFIFGAAGYLSVFVYIAACWLGVSFVVGVFGPSTTGRSLEVLEEA